MAYLKLITGEQYQIREGVRESHIFDLGPPFHLVTKIDGAVDRPTFVNINYVLEVRED